MPELSRRPLVFTGDDNVRLSQILHLDAGTVFVNARNNLKNRDHIPLTPGLLYFQDSEGFYFRDHLFVRTFH